MRGRDGVSITSRCAEEPAPRTSSSIPTAGRSSRLTSRASSRSHRSNTGVLYQQRGLATAVTFDGGGTRIACSHLDSIWIIDTESRRELVKLDEHVGRIRSLVFGTRDEMLVFAANDGTVGLWDAPHGTRAMR